MEDFQDTWSFCPSKHRTVLYELGFNDRSPNRRRTGFRGKLRATGDGFGTDDHGWTLSSFVNQWAYSSILCGALFYLDVSQSGSIDVPKASFDTVKHDSECPLATLHDLESYFIAFVLHLSKVE